MTGLLHGCVHCGHLFCSTQPIMFAACTFHKILIKPRLLLLAASSEIYFTACKSQYASRLEQLFQLLGQNLSSSLIHTNHQ
jgi:DNA-directed RNA polymerase subunit RPC12/RpoP